MREAGDSSLHQNEPTILDAYNYHRRYFDDGESTKMSKLELRAKFKTKYTVTSTSDKTNITKLTGLTFRVYVRHAKALNSVTKLPRFLHSYKKPSISGLSK
jgi:hypothetical protein